MARVKLSSDAAQTEYLPAKDWEHLQKKLEKARKICKQLAQEYGLKLFRDSRWPATGIEEKKIFKCRYIRITLNPKYLEDHYIFFELREHSIISFFSIYSKLTVNRVIAKYEGDQIDDEILLLNDLKRLLITPALHKI
jgi:5-bromo-4-chloroindolyl phosphate hydrolysis protein